MSWLRVFLSFFIVFHLWVVFTTPFQSELLAKIQPRWISSYASLIGINTSWAYFSPEPAKRDYLVVEYYKTKSSDEIWKESVWPPPRQNFWFKETFARRRYAANFFMSDSSRLKLFIRYICRTESAQKIVLKRFEEVPPELLNPSNGVRRIESGRHTFYCKEWV